MPRFRANWLGTSKISVTEFSATLQRHSAWFGVGALSPPRLPKVKERRDLVFTLAERGGNALSQRYQIHSSVFSFAVYVFGML